MNSALSDLQVFLASDFSQAEVRILAEASGDNLLISQFNSGADIHSTIGATLTGWTIERIKTDKSTRKLCKNMIFGIIYGLGRENLFPYVVAKIRAQDGENADLTGITKTKLVKLYDKFFKTYDGVRVFMEQMTSDAEKRGYVETMFGFRRWVFKNDASRRTFWANQAKNTPIQGAAHTLLLIALAMINMKPRTYNLLQTPLMEVHDALYFRVRLGDLPGAFLQCQQLLQQGVFEYALRYFKLKFRVPFLSEASAGFCMGSMCDYDGGALEEFLEKWRAKQKEVESKSWADLVPKFES
jgi:DNA polymerase-1